MRTLLRILAGIALCLAMAPAEAASLKVGQPAPDFHVTQFDGTKLSLADFRGQVLLINIWATWCGPCRNELPLLNSFYKIAGKWGLRVIAVTTEDSAPMSQLKPVQDAFEIPFARRFKGNYGVLKNAVPTNFVIDRAGIVRYAAPGAFTLDELNEILIPLLKEPASAPAASGPNVVAGAH